MKTPPIGERIAAARRQRGTSREDLVRLWNRALSTVRNWELGLTEPKGDDLAMVEAWLAEKATRKAVTR